MSITNMEKSLTSVLADFLENPVIELQVTDSKKVAQLQDEIARLKGEVERLQYMYSVECQYSLKYRDALQAHGIKVN